MSQLDSVSFIKDNETILTHEQVFFLDLITSSANILENFQVTSAELCCVTFEKEVLHNLEPKHLRIDWKVVLPLGFRAHDHWILQRKIETSDWSSGLCSLFRSVISIGVDRKSQPIVTFDHRIRVEPAQYKDKFGVEHILFARMQSDSEKSYTFICLRIAEVLSDLKLGYLRKFLSQSNNTAASDVCKKLNDENNSISKFKTVQSFIDEFDDKYGSVKNMADNMSAVFWLFALAIHRKFSSSSFISKKLLVECWDLALESMSRNTGLPWEYQGPDTSGILPSGGRPGARVPTFTLSLDLRKSTSLMDQVEQPGAFAIWLETLSELCREIVHDNGGIFDKFTGDGVIAHFAVAYDPNEKIPPSNYDFAVSWPKVQTQAAAALTCGCELVRAVQELLKLLQPLLRFDIGTAGPSVGIAFDDASWSLDRDGRPIVVGKGVVNACRITAAPAGSIEVANNVVRFIKRMDSFTGFAASIRTNNVDHHKDLRSEVLPRDAIARIRATLADDPLPGRRRHELEAKGKAIFDDVGEMHHRRSIFLGENGK